MAIAFTALTAGENSSGVSSASTASVSPTTGRLQLLAVSSRMGTSTDPAAPTVSGCGLTWVQVASILWDTTSSSRKRTTLFRALGTPSTGSLTIDFSSVTQSHIEWTWDEASGVDTGGANGANAVVQSATNKDESGSGTSLTVTLGTFGSANNATYGVFCVDDNSVLPYTAGSGFTKLQEHFASGFLCGGTEYKLSNDTSVDITWGAAGVLVGGIAVEVKAGTTTQTLTPALFTNGQTFYAPTVTRGAKTLAPSLVTNEQTFHAPTVTKRNTLLPNLVTNTQVFYGPVVSAGVVTFAPSLVTNGQTFYSPTVSSSGGLQSLLPSLVTNTQTFFGATLTGSYQLSPALFTNTQTFHSATVFAQNQLAPALLANSQIFYSATVSRGAVTLEPTLVTNTQIFYAPTVLQQSNVELLPGLLTNEQVFFSPTVALSPQAQTQFGGWFTSAPTPTRTRKARDEERQRLGILPAVEVPVTPAEARELTHEDRQRAHRAARKLLERFAPEPTAPIAAVTLPASDEQPTIGPAELPMEVQATLLAAQKKRAFEQDLVYIVATLIS